MSFDPLIKALEENPALAEELGNAKTPRDLDAILDAHGIEKPDSDSQFPDVTGGSDAGSVIPGKGTTPGPNRPGLDTPLYWTQWGWVRHKPR